ncbi:MAG: molybdenum cofactor guanylyltransferase [Rhodothermales bacterium]
MSAPQKPNPITGLILAGGQSRRFGSDKALYELNGQALITRCFNLLKGIASPVMISVANESKTYDTPAIITDAMHVADQFQDAGPLGGLHAGLKAAQSPWLFVTAVDLPFITHATITSLTDLISDDLDAVIATDGDRIQPLLGCYKTSLAPQVAHRIYQKKLSATKFVLSLRHMLIQITPAELRNVNQLGDLP